MQTRTGKLFETDPGTGESQQVDLGGASLVNGDGMVRRGAACPVDPALERLAGSTRSAWPAQLQLGDGSDAECQISQQARQADHR